MKILAVYLEKLTSGFNCPKVVGEVVLVSKI